MARQYSFGGSTMQAEERERAEQAEGQAVGVKVCPRCGARLFEDMDVCYGCLYDFRNPGEGFVSLPDPEGQASGAKSAVAARPLGRQAGPSSTKAGPTQPREMAMPGDPGATLAFGSELPPVVLRVRSPSVEFVIPVGDGGVSFGRSPENDVILPARTVSREHLRVVRRGDDTMAFDQGATNPTLLNGNAISGGVRIADGDVLEVGNVSIKLEPAG